MSIATDLTRLQTAKADLKTAIEGKGVTVPSATKIDGYADLVESIETGGGGDDNLKKLLTNTLTSFSDSQITNIPAYAFYSKSALQSISIPNATYLGDSAFYNSGLTGDLRLDNILQAAGNALKGTKIVNLELPKLNWISWGNIFRGCSLLEKVRLGISSTSLGSTASAGDDWFRDCPKLDTVIIGYTNRIITLVGVAAFNNTPFASSGTGGTLYVPQSMIASYESNTNWSTIIGYTNNQILPIEGSAYENYYFDGTPIT